MPPITRTQTRSLPTKGKDTSLPTKKSLSRPLRHRRTATHPPKAEKTFTTTSINIPGDHPQSPPRFTIDLSLPPSQRYAEACHALGDEMRGLQSLFDEVVGGFLPSWLPLPTVLLNWIASALLWRVCDAEEDAELNGISTTTAIPKYLLIAFNVFLDLLMGCSSDGAAVQDTASLSPSSTKMVHFRTLDWAMPSLRRVLVILDFVLEPGGELVASSITYAGFVGVLTGVRRGVSLSLDFRAVRNEGEGGWVGGLRYYVHLGLVMLGFRRGIGSILRGYLIPRGGAAAAGDVSARGSLPSCADVVEQFSCREKPLLSTPCYLCFSSRREMTIIEKDLSTAKLRSSTEFIVVTNADVDDETNNAANGPEERAMSKLAGKTAKTAKEAPPPTTTALEELIEDANERKVCAEKNYRSLLRRRSKTFRKGGSDDLEDPADTSALLPSVEDIMELVQKYPTTNECTHFAAVLDPLEGNIAWCRYWLEPVDEI